MPKVLTKVNVAYPDDFYAALECLDRTKFGEVGCTDFMDEDIHNCIYLVFDWTSLQEARVFWASDIGKKHIASWQSVETPKFVYLRDRLNDQPA